MSGARGIDQFAQIRADRLEDLHWMARTGENLTGAARRLGMNRDALKRWLERHDHALLRTLVGHEPRDHNAPNGINFHASRQRQVLA